MLYYSFAEIQSLKKQPTEAFYEKKVFLKNSKFSQENTFVRVPFKIKLQASKSKKNDFDISHWKSIYYNISKTNHPNIFSWHPRAKEIHKT